MELLIFIHGFEITGIARYYLNQLKVLGYEVKERRQQF